MHIELHQLSVRYPGQAQPAVDGVSLGLRAGEIGALLGPSGCGKTTLLRAVAGLEPASAGEIAISGRRVDGAGTHVPPEQRQVGMVFQDYALFPHLDVGRNVAFGLPRGLPGQERQARVAEVLALVGLAGREARMPHELSGGQQQRVALARALAPRPQLLLLDEPFSSLDVDLRERLAHEIRAILKAARATALFVTHDQLEAFAIGDRIGVMHAGRLHQWDEAAALYREPATRFVADFIGRGVFFPATLQQVGDRLAVRTALGLLHDGHEGAAAGGPAPGACEVLLRPEDIVCEDGALVQAQVVRRDFRGASCLYTLRLATGETVLAQWPSGFAPGVGDWIGIRPRVQRVLAFPPGAGPAAPPLASFSV